MKTTFKSLRPKKSQPPSAGSVVHFEYIDPAAQSVCLAGTFNDWHPGSLPMSSSRPGVWEKDLELAPGTYEYLLVVDGYHRSDPRSAEKIENPFGGLNSVLKVHGTEKTAG